MNLLGTAQLVFVKNGAGVLVKAWDLTPWGGRPLELGLPDSPLPPTGTTADRTNPDGRILRVEVSTGEVYEVEPGAEPPTIGPTGGPKVRASLFSNPLVLAVGAGIAWALFLRKRR